MCRGDVVLQLNSCPACYRTRWCDLNDLSIWLVVTIMITKSRVSKYTIIFVPTGNVIQSRIHSTYTVLKEITLYRPVWLPALEWVYLIVPVAYYWRHDKSDSRMYIFNMGTGTNSSSPIYQQFIFIVYMIHGTLALCLI